MTSTSPSALLEHTNDLNGSQQDEPSFLSRIFDQGLLEFLHFSKDGMPVKHNKLAQLLVQWHRIAYLTEKAFLFSANESLDDICNADLKFALVPFVLAELNYMMPSLDSKAARIRSSLVYWERFINHMSQLGLCEADCLEQQIHDPEKKRNEKVSRFKSRQELDRSIQEILERRREMGVEDHEIASSRFDAEVERDLLIKMLKKSIFDCYEHYDLSVQELPLAEMMESSGKMDSPDETKKTARGIASASHKLQTHCHLKKSDSLTGNPHKLYCRDPSSVKLEYLRKVFQPSHELPSITLEQVAEWEMEYLKRSQKQQSVVKEYAEEEISEEQELKDRDWDDWKDNNPKGIGNKKANIG